MNKSFQHIQKFSFYSEDSGIKNSQSMTVSLPSNLKNPTLHTNFISKMQIINDCTFLLSSDPTFKSTNSQSKPKQIILKFTNNQILDKYDELLDFDIQSFDIQRLGGESLLYIFGETLTKEKSRISTLNIYHFSNCTQINDNSFKPALLKSYIVEYQDKNKDNIVGLNNYPGNCNVTDVINLKVSNKGDIIAMGTSTGNIILIFCNYENLYSIKTSDEEKIKFKLIKHVSKGKTENSISNLFFSNTSPQKIYFTTSNEGNINCIKVDMENHTFSEQKLHSENGKIDEGLFQVKDTGDEFIYNSLSKGKLLIFQNEKMNYGLSFDENDILSLCYAGNHICLVINTNEGQFPYIAIFDIKNELFLYCKQLQEPLLKIAGEPKENTLWYLTYNSTNEKVSSHRLIELDDKTKLDGFYKRRNYEIAIRFAKNSNYPINKIKDINKNYAEYLYIREDYKNSILQYIETINYLDPSIVIQKFTDGSKLSFLCTYLESLKKNEVYLAKVSEDDMKDLTGLLVNCYIKLKRIGKLGDLLKSSSIKEKEMILETALEVCKAQNDVNTADNLVFDQKIPYFIVQCLLELKNNAKEAIEKLEICNKIEQYKLFKSFGSKLMEDVPNETAFVMKNLIQDIVDAGNEDDIVNFINENPDIMKEIIQKEGLNEYEEPEGLRIEKPPLLENKDNIISSEGIKKIDQSFKHLSNVLKEIKDEFFKGETKKIENIITSCTDLFKPLNEYPNVVKIGAKFPNCFNVLKTYPSLVKIINDKPILAKFLHYYPGLGYIVNQKNEIINVLENYPLVASVFEKYPKVALLSLNNSLLASYLEKYPLLGKTLSCYPELIKIILEYPNVIKLLKDNLNLAKLLTEFPEFIEYMKEYPKVNKIISNKNEVNNIFRGIQEYDEKRRTINPHKFQEIDKKLLIYKVKFEIIKKIREQIEIRNYDPELLISCFKTTDKSIKLRSIIKMLVEEHKNPSQRCIHQLVEMLLDKYIDSQSNDYLCPEFEYLTSDKIRQYLLDMISPKYKHNKKIDLSYVSVLFQMNNFKEGALQLADQNRMDQELLNANLEQFREIQKQINDNFSSDKKELNEKRSQEIYDKIMNLCKKHGKLSFYFQVLTFFIRESNLFLITPTNQDRFKKLIQSLIDKNEISPGYLMYFLSLSKDSYVPFSLIKDFIINSMRELQLVQTKRKEIIAKSIRIDNINEDIKKHRTQAKQYNPQKCFKCHGLLKAPFVVFLCEHSFHTHCYAELAGVYENEVKSNNISCVKCKEKKTQNEEQIKEKQKSAKEVHLKFKEELKNEPTLNNKIDVLSQYIGIGLFDIMSEEERQLQEQFQQEQNQKKQNKEPQRAKR